MFAILTFAISIVDILTFRHFDFDTVTVEIFIVDILTVHPVSGDAHLRCAALVRTSTFLCVQFLRMLNVECGT